MQARWAQPSLARYRVMKFGKLLEKQLRGLESWPSIRYKALKKGIKSRVSTARQQSIFETGTFKRQLRDDMVSAPGEHRRMRLSSELCPDPFHSWRSTPSGRPRRMSYRRYATATSRGTTPTRRAGCFAG